MTLHPALTEAASTLSTVGNAPAPGNFDCELWQSRIGLKVSHPAAEPR